MSSSSDRQIKPSDLDRTWICFDGAPHNQACMRLSEFARMDASSELCPNTFQKKSQGRIPCPDRLQPAPTTVSFNAFDSTEVCADGECAEKGKSVGHYLRFLNQAVDAREFVQSGGPLIAGVDEQTAPLPPPPPQENEAPEDTGPDMGTGGANGNAPAQAAPPQRAPTTTTAPPQSIGRRKNGSAGAQQQNGGVVGSTAAPPPLFSLRRTPKPQKAAPVEETDFSLFG